jgi:hypothetical protein
MAGSLQHLDTVGCKRNGLSKVSLTNNIFAHTNYSFLLNSFFFCGVGLTSLVLRPLLAYCTVPDDR